MKLLFLSLTLTLCGATSAMDMLSEKEATVLFCFRRGRGQSPRRVRQQGNAIERDFYRNVLRKNVCYIWSQ